jgi:hypothetical protein
VQPPMGNQPRGGIPRRARNDEGTHHAEPHRSQ